MSSQRQTIGDALGVALKAIKARAVAAFMTARSPARAGKPLDEAEQGALMLKVWQAFGASFAPVSSDGSVTIGTVKDANGDDQLDLRALAVVNWEHVNAAPTVDGLDRAPFSIIWQDSASPILPDALWLKTGLGDTDWSKIWPIEVPTPNVGWKTALDFHFDTVAPSVTLPDNGTYFLQSPSGILRVIKRGSAYDRQPLECGTAGLVFRVKRLTSTYQPTNLADAALLSSIEVKLADTLAPFQLGTKVRIWVYVGTDRLNSTYMGGTPFLCIQNADASTGYMCLRRWGNTTDNVQLVHYGFVGVSANHTTATYQPTAASNRLMLMEIDRLGYDGATFALGPTTAPPGDISSMLIASVKESMYNSANWYPVKLNWDNASVVIGASAFSNNEQDLDMSIRRLVIQYRD